FGKPHNGYNNPDTCNSLDEGFAEFLPTLAAREIFGVAGWYDSMWNLEFPTKAWQACWSPGQTLEDFAVGALCWDLVARNGNTELTGLVGAGQQIYPVVYTNTVSSIPIGQLWSQLTSAQPGTVYDLRGSFGNPGLTIDLDGDGTFDVAPIDIPFLMHGFYPIDTDQTSTPDHTSITFYDVGYAQRVGGATRRNGSVGVTSHHVYNAAGTETQPPLIPRLKVVPGPHSNIGLTVLDALG